MTDWILWIAILAPTFAAFGWGMAFLCLFKTPAATFLKAWLRKRIIAANPQEDGRFEFKIVNAGGGLGRSKNGAAFLINPKHRFVEKSSGVPIFLVYGHTGLTIHPDDINLANSLKKAGYEDFRKLEQAINSASQACARMTNQWLAIDEALKSLDPEKDRTKIETLKNTQKQLEAELDKYRTIEVDGTSMDLETILSHFNISRRQGDLMESEIQNRVMAAEKKKAGGFGDLLKWAIIGAILLMSLGIVYTMVTGASGGSAAPAALPAAQAVTNATSSAMGLS